MSIETGLIPNPDFICGAESCGLDQTCVNSLDNPNYGVTNFDNIFMSLVTVFQIITLEGWTKIMYMTQTGFSYYSVFFYMPLIFIAGNLIINFTMAIIAISFKDISRSMIEKQAMLEKKDILSEILFRKIYKNTTRFEVTKGSGFFRFKSSMDETKKFLSEDGDEDVFEEGKEEENPEIRTNIKFNKAIMSNAKSTVILGEGYDLESDNSINSFGEKFESNFVIDLNSAFSKVGTLHSRPAFNKKSSENGISRILEPQFSLYKCPGSAKAELNQIVTDIQPDVEAQQKTKQDYEKLRSVVTIKHRTLNFLQKNPERVKNTRLELVENFKILSDSYLEVTSHQERPLEYHSEFTYRQIGQKDPLIHFFESKSEIVQAKYLEFPNKHKLLYHLSMKSSNKAAFFLITPKTKTLIEEKSKDFYTQQGEWSGLDLDPSNPLPHSAFIESLSILSYNLWEPGYLGTLQKTLFPLKHLITHNSQIHKLHNAPCRPNQHHSPNNRPLQHLRIHLKQPPGHKHLLYLLLRL